jgi:peptidoglycan-N-acetylglucosamine deacetylase
LFRFPFGDTTPLDIAVVNDLGYVCVRWTVDTLGWKGTSGGMDAAQVLDRVVQAATPGEIVLLHVGANPDDGSTLDADALPSVIRELRARGYTFVTLQALLQAPGS